VGAGKRGLMKVQDKKTKQHTTKQKHKTVIFDLVNQENILEKTVPGIIAPGGI